MATAQRPARVTASATGINSDAQLQVAEVTSMFTSAMQMTDCTSEMTSVQCQTLRTLWENINCILQAGKENKEEKQTIHILKRTKRWKKPKTKFLKRMNRTKRKTRDTEFTSFKMKEKEPSATEGQPLNRSVEQGHVQLGERKIDRQMRKLEKENRGQRKILKKLTEE
jgi:hypothetical protein